MPHVAGSSSGSGGGNSGGGGNSVVVAGGSGSSSSSSGRIRDDPNDCDEVKVFKCEEDEGEGSSDDVMNDDKRDLIRATEYDQKGGRLSPLSPLSPGSYSSGGGHSSFNPKNGGQSSSLRPDPSSLFGGSGGKLEVGGMPYPTPINIGLLGYHYPNGSPLTGISRLLGFQCNGMDGLTPPPPPAHMGFPGLSRQYPFGMGYPYAGLGPEVSQVSPWPQGIYPSISNAGSAGGSPGFRYSSSLSSSLPSDFYRQYPPMLPGSGLGGHPGLSHLVGQQKHDAHPHLDNHRSSLSDQKSSDNHHSSKNASDSGQSSNSQNEKKKPHIKKPLNAFMLYMKEMRAKVVAECTLKESAAINQILGRRWHALGREEQAKYYELARRERQLHMQMYPNWSSAQNRTHHEKKRKKKQDQKFDGGNSMKKCRARYGLDQQSQWCKPCRRKKKCIRYLEEANNGTGGSGGANSVNSADDNLGSAGSAGEPLSPESKAGDSDMDTSSNMDMSSPSFSLTSPGMSMASPGMSLPSPALTSPSGVMPSPIASLASPAVSLPSLQSPMTPSMSEDRHPISSVSSAASSVNFTTTASNGTSSSHHQQHATSSSSHHHNSSRNLNNNINNIANNNHHNHPSNSSSSSSGFGKQQHHSNHFHPGSSPNFGFGLGHLFNGSSVPNGGMGYPFPFPIGLNLPNFQKPARNPVGTNPHDINNPLSVNQLTGQCNSSSSSASSLSSITSNERSSSVSSQKSSHSSSHNNHNHHRSDRARSRDRINVTNSDNKSSPENKTNPVPAPVIGVSS